MKVTHSEFVGSFASVTQLPKRKLPEIAFAGRSNVGKSSLINRLLSRKNLARTSGTPGKTRHLNFINVSDQLYVVDLPGYGFAKASKVEKERWRKLIESYLTQSTQLSGVVSIIDARHGPMASDLELIEWLAHIEVPCLVVATKIDKLKSNQLAKAKREITSKIELFPVNGPIFFSAQSGAGKRELWQAIDQLLEN